MLLRPGALVDLIAPASQLRGADRELLPQAVELLESWGLRVRPRLSAARHFYLAGTDRERGDHLIAALQDKSSRAIFCLRGGYGSSRLLPRLSEVRHWTPKILVGYSDISALHVSLGRLTGAVDCIYGPNVATRQLLANNTAAAESRAILRQALFSPQPLVESVDILRPGRASGPLVGGCLSILTSLLGTKNALRTAGTILFLEDAGEAPYRVDRMLTQLRQAGSLSHVKGVVFGEMRDCLDPYNDLRDVIRDCFATASYPVAFGLRSGHGLVNLSLRLGASAELNDNEQQFRLDPKAFNSP
jgi:muramoyltetrapeptide carboxypeptidase